MRLLLKAVATIVISFGIGAGSAWIAAGSSLVGLEIRNGPWRGSARVGDSRAGLYVRAYSAKTAWIAASPDEVIYFLAHEDSTGETLRHDCGYVVTGGALDTRWWSVTVYRDSHWIPNENHRYAYSSTSIEWAEGKHWRIVVSTDPAAENWLPTDGKPGEISFALRLYNPSSHLRMNLADEELPGIRRESCRGARS